MTKVYKVTAEIIHDLHVYVRAEDEDAARAWAADHAEDFVEDGGFGSGEWRLGDAYEVPSGVFPSTTIHEVEDDKEQEIT